MLSTHLPHGLPSGLFPIGFPINNLYTFLFSPIRATCPAHVILLDNYNFTWRRLQIIQFLFVQFSPPSRRPYILPSTLFSNTLSLCSSLNVTDQVLDPYRSVLFMHMQIFGV
jgi:hypothetical protein